MQSKSRLTLKEIVLQYFIIDSFSDIAELCRYYW